MKYTITNKKMKVFQISILFNNQEQNLFTKKINFLLTRVNQPQYDDRSFALYLDWRYKGDFAFLALQLNEYSDNTQPCIWKIHYVNWLLEIAEIPLTIGVNEVRRALLDPVALKELNDKLIATTRAKLIADNIKYENPDD